ncbi:hypothetical protein LTR62_003159 [Meristemomyces frigidus]|uniref:Uncharacterized protein n=1 Tax=Meristemomyces frigidus TaxID=1508187 RepID=A0AAN7TPW5_9PEZI|nr:hypothetical protein LTR62_003159 [Meristemomyces frigidus]
MEPYDPREWGQSRQASGPQIAYGRTGAVRSTREATGMEESMPSPPPPYTPETPGGSTTASRTTSMRESLRVTTSPLTIDSVHSSPQGYMSHAFPPPPGQSSRVRERSTSGLAGPRALLAGLRGKQTASADLQPQHAVYSPPFENLHPQAPAARRALSTGHLQSSGQATYLATSSTPVELESPESRWQPGMPLPGPPPGPPPPGARSQSLNRYPTGSSTQSSSSRDGSSRKIKTIMSTLGPVPPTPAGWTNAQDNDPASSQALSSLDRNMEAEAYYQPLRIETGASRETSITRRPATRGSSAQGIHERRSASKKAKDRVGDSTSPPSDDLRPSEQAFRPVDGTISQRREHTRTVSSFPENSGRTPSLVEESPSSKMPDALPHHALSSVLTPPYTPAVDNGAFSRNQFQSTRASSKTRATSQLMHTPNEANTVPAALRDTHPPSASSTRSTARLDAFAIQALERHRMFVEKETMAATDEERLELFAVFMVHESRLRRDRYHNAYTAMAGDIVDLTRDMWRSYARDSKRAATPSTSMSSFDPTAPSSGSDGRPSSAQGVPSSASSFGDFTPATDAASIGEVADAFDRSESRQWPETFKPTLSPIPSMAQSTVPDEESSRGRAPSRWWEQSNSGSRSGSIGKPSRLERSRRETKYMGVSANELQGIHEPSPALSQQSASQGARASIPDCRDEYPPEKTGWYENDDIDTPMATPAKIAKIKSPTSSSSPLDISRLITLPPPYPRHHPAVNNSHPLLNVLRADYRALADQSGTQAIKDAFQDSDCVIRAGQSDLNKERRRTLLLSIQGRIAEGTISFAGAAQAEKEFDAEEAERSKANARANFERFESQVAQPLNTLLTERISKADSCLTHLKQELNTRDQTSDPNRAQEEGDEQPERLETLTLLKWLFEAREALHRQLFDLHGERSGKYSEVILTPYRILRAQTKIDEAEAFFAKDTVQRNKAYTADSRARYKDLLAVTEHNVSRGVEDQLSAFWDIAPDLLSVIARVPAFDELEGFRVLVPEREYEENPAYAQWPLQYLYSLLEHAEKSAYQFIEGQVNLLCLLHEVRTLVAVQGLVGNADEGERRRVEEGLTSDLQEKVGEVEGLWREALGEGLEGCKARVRRWLEGCGGWEEGLEG